MALIVNGTTAKKLIVNGTTCKKGIYNGTQVFNSDITVVSGSAFQNGYSFSGSRMSFNLNSYDYAGSWVSGTGIYTKRHDYATSNYHVATAYLTVPTKDYSNLAVTARFMVSEGGHGGICAASFIVLRPSAVTSLSNDSTDYTSGAFGTLGETWKANWSESRSVNWNISGLTSNYVLQLVTIWYGHYPAGADYDTIHKIVASAALTSVVLT